MAWMHKAVRPSPSSFPTHPRTQTSNDTYLTLATPFLNTALTTFFPSGILTEPCEIDRSCNRDQQGFKAILARNLVYLYRQTTEEELRTRIQVAVDTSVEAMLGMCDDAFRCGGNWYVTPPPPSPFVRS